jgi:transcriptional regulator with XRE-family HTH domain
MRLPQVRSSANRVLERRRSLGLSQLEVSRASGLSRQLVSAVETGRHVPSVRAAMDMATALGCTVEELFGEPSARASYVPALEEQARETAGVVAVRVGESVSYHPLTEDGQSWARADGIYRDGRIQLFEDGAASGIAVAGCDPALGLLASLLPSTGPRRLAGIPASSGKALRALNHGRIHGALVHGRPGHLPPSDRPVRRFTLARWRVGLGYPGRRPDLEKLARGELRITRRDPEAEVSRALERRLSSLGLPIDLRGPPATSHLEAARAVRYGAAEVALTMEAAARAWGLELLELEEHVCKLQVDTRWLDLPGMQALIELVGSEPFRARLNAVGGYDVSEAGEEG